MTITPARADAGPATVPRQRRAAALALIAGLVALGLLCVLSIAIGSKRIPLDGILQALTSPGDDETTAIVRGLRVPRTPSGCWPGWRSGSPAR